jgi:hypothetical protein
MHRHNPTAQLLYDIDGVRVVETREPPPWLQESYELFQSWPEGTPTPHYFPPRPGHLTSILHQFQAALGYQRQSHPTPPQVVTQLAKEVSYGLTFPAPTPSFWPQGQIIIIKTSF